MVILLGPPRPPFFFVRTDKMSTWKSSTQSWRPSNADWENTAVTGNQSPKNPGPLRYLKYVPFGQITQDAAFSRNYTENVAWQNKLHHTEDEVLTLGVLMLGVDHNVTSFEKTANFFFCIVILLLFYGPHFYCRCSLPLIESLQQQLH